MYLKELGMMVPGRLPRDSRDMYIDIADRIYTEYRWHYGSADFAADRMKAEIARLSHLRTTESGPRPGDHHCPTCIRPVSPAGHTDGRPYGWTHDHDQSRICDYMTRWGYSERATPERYVDLLDSRPSRTMPRYLARLHFHYRSGSPILAAVSSRAGLRELISARGQCDEYSVSGTLAYWDRSWGSLRSMGGFVPGELSGRTIEIGPRGALHII